jgi:hypothetical protein
MIFSENRKSTFPDHARAACARQKKLLTEPEREVSMSQESLESRRPPDYVHRFFGGPPLSVIGRLILMSILVGVVLTAIGLDPWNIIDSVRRLVLHVWNMGFDTIRWLWQYFLLGAVIVVPLWFLVRLARAPRGM